LKTEQEKLAHNNHLDQPSEAQKAPQ